MKRMMICIFIFCVIVFGAVGDAGVAILKVPVDARICGMGEAACAFIQSASAIYYNPAGLGSVDRFDISLMHCEWLLGMGHEYGAIAFSFGNAGALGISANYWGSGDIQVVTIRGDTIPGETFSASDWIFNLGYGKKFGSFAFGLGFQYCIEHNEDFSGSSMAGNLGLQYASPVKGLNIGASVSNLGTSMQLDDESFSLPLIMRFGWNYTLKSLNIAQDITMGDKFYFLVGME
ncbi:MAG: PorV/PorQ family protein, partial [candidate division WOR-3 bacterium]